MKRHLISLLGSMSIIAFAAANEGGGGSASGLSIEAALGKLSVDNADDWTEAGLPSMARMKELTGNSDLTRAEVGEARPGFNRSTLTTGDVDKSRADNLGAKGDHDGDGNVGGAKTPAGASLEGDAAEKAGQANERLEETGKDEAEGAAASQAGDDGLQREKPRDGAAEALASDKDRPAEATAGNVDHSSSTQHDAVHQERLGDDFGLDPKDDDKDNIPVDNRGRKATDIDVQAVGLQEKLSDEEAQASTAAALAGDDSAQSDYDAGFIRGYELGKTEGAKGLAEQAKPEEIPEATREQRNAEVQTESAAPASGPDIAGIVAAANGDAIALCEALVQAAAGDGYKRNSALTSFVRGYMVSQAEIKEVQRRLDVRNEQRRSESERQAEGNTTLKA